MRCTCSGDLIALFWNKAASFPCDFSFASLWKQQQFWGVVQNSDIAITFYMITWCSQVKHSHLIINGSHMLFFKNLPLKFWLWSRFVCSSLSALHSTEASSFSFNVSLSCPPSYFWLICVLTNFRVAFAANICRASSAFLVLFSVCVLCCGGVSLLCRLSLSMRRPPHLPHPHTLSPAMGSNRWTNTCENTQALGLRTSRTIDTNADVFLFSGATWSF